MPAGSIPIETYRVTVARNASDPFARLTISGPVAADGRHDQATLFFFPTYEAMSGWAFDVGGAGPESVHVVAQMPWADFDRMYDVIRNEAPLHLSYAFEASEATRKPVNLLAIESGNEPPGEGPHDADSVEAFVSSLERSAVEFAR